MRVQDYLTHDEIKSLNELSDLRGLQAVATSWLMIAGCFFLVAVYPSVFSIFFSLIILGGRHLALAILMHDCSHHTLFRTRKLNDFFGKWFCGYPTWKDLRRYRQHHWNHHRYAGSDLDPDLDLIAPFPVTKISMLRKILRDLSGISGMKRVYGNLLMDFGFIEYTVSSKVVKIDPKGKTVFYRLKTGLQKLHGMVITNAVLFLILFSMGHASLYWLWIVSYLTTFSAIVRIRSIAEHACTEQDLDPIKCTRTTIASPLARVTFAPHRVNYHLEHHLLMSVPYFKLKRFHKMLDEKGALRGAYISKNYLEVLRFATRKA